MPTGSIPVLGTGQKFDTSATPLSLVLRDSNGGVTNGPETITQLALNGSLNVAWNVQTGSYAILWGSGKDHLIYADTSGGSITLTLPAPASVLAGGMLRVLRKSASNVLTLARNGSENINGAASNKVVPTTAFLIVEIFCDGTDWIVGTHTVI